MHFLKVLKPLLVLTFISCLISPSCSAQNSTITQYFDSSWKRTSKDSAFFFTELVKEDSFYRCTSYWMKSKKLYCISAYADTLFSSPFDGLLRYYESGRTEDSTYFNPDGSFKNTYHYYENGKLWVHYQYNSKTHQQVTDAYDITGNRLQDFIFSREADFKEGKADWQQFLAENLRAKVPVKKGAPLGQYQVVIRFVVGSDGNIFGLQAETNFGYGMEEEVMRVLKKSPKWTPAIQMGKQVKAYRRQPITFAVEKE